MACGNSSCVEKSKAHKQEMNTKTFLCSILFLLTIFDTRSFSVDAEKDQGKQFETYDTNNPMVCVCSKFGPKAPNIRVEEGS